MKLRNKASNILSIFLVFILLFSNIIYAKNNDEESIINESVQQIGPGTYFKQTDIINSKEKFRINTIETTIGTNYIKIEGADNGSALGTATVSKQAEAKIQKDSRVIGAINVFFFVLWYFSVIVFVRFFIYSSIMRHNLNSLILRPYYFYIIFRNGEGQLTGYFFYSSNQSIFSNVKACNQFFA